MEFMSRRTSVTSFALLSYFYGVRRNKYLNKKEVRLLSEEIAKRSEDITDEIWNQVNEFNREMVQDYLDNQTDLSLKTRPAYRSGLRVFLYM